MAAARAQLRGDSDARPGGGAYAAAARAACVGLLAGARAQLGVGKRGAVADAHTQLPPAPATPPAPARRRPRRSNTRRVTRTGRRIAGARVGGTAELEQGEMR